MDTPSIAERIRELRQEAERRLLLGDANAATALRAQAAELELAAMARSQARR